jgi:outer membrane protein assembly factor BamB
VSTASTTYALDLTTHRPMWSYPAGGLLALSNQGILFIARSNGSLTAIKVKE